MTGRALRFAGAPALIALFVTLARFFGERAELPGAVTYFIGISWLTIFVAIYLGIRLEKEKRPYRLLFLTLLIFALLSRIPVVALWWITKTFSLGTHYDVFSSFSQAFFAQFGLGTVIQVISGGIPGSLTLYFKRKN